MITILNFIEVVKTDEPAIREMSNLASKIVKDHYDPILGSEQNNYMIDKFQSVNSIAKQLEEGYEYYFINLVVKSKNSGEIVHIEKSNKIGFFAFYPREKDMYLSKLYIEKEQRGKGFSKDVLKFIIAKTKDEGLNSIVLNVNKDNNISIFAYERLGFSRIGEEKNDIGQGYYMDDYVYKYSIKEGELC